MSRFVDLSSNNPLPDLAAYKAAGHKHLCRKVSEGVGYHWAEGDTLADQAHRIGLRVGHYHWLRPDSAATAQAAYFVTLLKGHLEPGDWLMCDFEATAGASDPADVSRAAQLHDFCVYVQSHLPEHPLFVYTGNWYLDGKPHCQAETRRWPVVMSDYSGADTLPNPYRLHYVAWQFTDHADVAGLSAPVDYNRWIVEPDFRYPPDSPHWSDTVTRDQIIALIKANSVDKTEAAHIAQEAARAVARAVEFGGDQGWVTEKTAPGLHVPPNQGDRDRLAALEAKTQP